MPRHADDVKGQAASGSNREGQSTEAGRRGGAARSSVEGPVMGLERRGCVVRPWPLANWKRDEAKPFKMQRLTIGSRVTREGHARFWEHPEVKFLEATRQPKRPAIATTLQQPAYLRMDGTVGQCQNSTLSPAISPSAGAKAGCVAEPKRSRRWSQVLFREFAELLRNGTGGFQCDRRVADRLPSEATAYRVDSAIDHPTRHAFFGAGTALLIFKAKREF